MKSVFILASFVALSTACSNSSKGFHEAGKTVPAEKVLEQMNSKSLSEADAQTLRAMSPASFHGLLLAKSSDQAFSVGGFNFHGIKSRLEQSEAAFDKIADEYGSVGEFLDARNLSLEGRLSEGGLQELLSKASDFVNGSAASAKGLQLYGTSTLESDDHACDEIEATPVMALVTRSALSVAACGASFFDTIEGSATALATLELCVASLGGDVVLSAAAALNTSMCETRVDMDVPAASPAPSVSGRAPIVK